MNKRLSLAIMVLSIGSISLFSGCQQSDPIQSESSGLLSSSVRNIEESSEAVSSTQAITAASPVEPLTIQGDIPVAEGETIDTSYVADNCCYLSVLNRQLSMIYPTVRQYRLNLEDMNLTVLKERDPQSLERVWQFFEMNGSLYESVISVADGNLVGKVLVDGNELWNGIVPGIPNAPSFAIDDGNVYVTVHELAGDVLYDQVFRIDPSAGMNLLWKSGDENGFGPIERISADRDPYGRLVFQASQSGVEKLVFIGPDGYEAVRFDQPAFRIVPLQDRALVVCRKNPQPNPSETFVTDSTDLADNVYYSVSPEDSQVVSLESTDPQIGNKIAEAGAENSFLFKDISDSATCKGTVENDQIVIEKLSDVTPGLASYWRLNDSTALVCSISDYGMDNWSNYHFYLVQMQ